MVGLTGRVVCTLDAASHLIDGVLFAAFPVADGTPIRISERVSAERAARFLGIPGFRAPQDGDPSEPIVERELVKLRDELAAAAAPAEAGADAARTVEEMRRANLALSGDLDAARGEIAELKAALQANSPEATTALNATLAQRTADLERAQQAVAALEEGVRSRDADLAQAREALTARDAELAQVRDALQAKDAELKAAEKELKKLQKEK